MYYPDPFNSEIWILYALSGGAKIALAHDPPRVRLDFSDPGELMHIPGFGELDMEDFMKRSLSDEDTSVP